MKLTSNLSLSFLVLVVISISVVGFISFQSSRKAIEREVENHLSSVNVLKENQMDRWVNEGKKMLESMAQRPQVRKYTAVLSASGSEPSAREHAHRILLTDHLNFAARSSDEFLNLFILQAGDGRIIVSTNQVQEGKYREIEPYFNEGKKGSFVQEIYYSRELEEPAMTISTPVKDDLGNVIGVLAGHFNLRDLSKIMRQGSGLRKTEETYLVNTFNFFITEPLFGKNYALKKAIYTRGVEAALSGKMGVELYDNYRGMPVIGAYRWLSNYKLAIITEIDQAEAFSPVARLRWATLFIGIGAALLASLIGWFMAVTIVRPVRRLVEGTEEIARGNLDYRIEVRSGNEIGNLATAFNSMAARLGEAGWKSERQTRLMESVNKVFREAMTCQTEEQVGNTALRLAEELTGSKFGFIGEINAVGLMDAIAISNPDRKPHDISVSGAKSLIKNIPPIGIDRDTLRGGKSRIVNAGRIETHLDRVGPLLDQSPLTCFLSIPFKREDKTVGMIGLANKEGGYREEDQATVETLSVAFYEALLRKRMERIVQEQAALKTKQAELLEQMRGDLLTDILCRKVIMYLCKGTEAPTGLMWLADDDGMLRLAASYAHKDKKHLPRAYKPGEGLVGQAALEGKVITLTDVPKSYFTVASGLGEMVPRSIYIKPIVHNGRVKAVIELGMLHELSGSQSLFLDTVMENIAMAIESSESRTRLTLLLEETQRQAEELQAQQEDLKTSNEELEEQTRRLKESEERLKAQQEELQVTNEELEEKNELLERQKREVETARSQIQEKAEEVALASKYKSEFLANMSHELRTPLNSLLLLAQSLARNKDGNLTDDQVESARVIHGSGSDLLNLINEILDLSKIESGRMDLHMAALPVSDLAEGIRAAFEHVAGEKGLTLEIDVETEAPYELTTDIKRVEQVVRNLVSNAIKFTETGRVKVTFGRPAAGADLYRSGLDPGQTLRIAIEDTGIGIAPEDRKRIFEAFQQADSGTARKYGGTGLGLSISRQLTQLLGGEIQLVSEPGKGTTFTLYLPITAEGKRKTERGAAREAERGSGIAQRPKEAEAFKSQIANQKSQIPIPDDRDNIAKGDRVILVIEDDPKFAKVICDTCHERRFKCLAAPAGEAGLELASRYVPDGVILDIRMPGMDGWAVLDALKNDIRTRHIPVHVISVEEATTESLRKGAIGHATKPITREALDRAFEKLEQISMDRKKRVLLVEDDEKMRNNVRQLIGDGEVDVDEAATGEQALQAMRTTPYGCLVLDLGLPDMSGVELLARIEREGIPLPPVIIHTSRDLTEQEELDLREYAESIVIKDVRSQERLLDEVSLFLHRMVGRMPETKKQIIRNLHETDVLLQNKKVLIVDDDMRTTFAVSRLLAERGMNPVKAGNGEQALQTLEQEPDVDLVLMDIMMPKMDGYEAMKRIRAQDRFRKLPIIALTAKAMPEDRQKCIEVGANDYLPKPVDQDRLVSMMRVWLYR